jgi:hypothetical protein
MKDNDRVGHDYRETYSSMTDGQLLNLALEENSLVATAKIALEEELANRNFGAAQVKEQAANSRMGRLSENATTQTLNGFGTALYGNRNEQSDASFIKTKWIVLFWIPLIPLRSFRVRYIGHGSSFLGWSWKYLILDEFRPDIRQVINTYCLITLSVFAFWLLVALTE